MAACFGCCDMMVLVILIGLIRAVSGNACAKWHPKDLVTVCTQSSRVTNEIYLDFSNTTNKLPCACRATFTGNDNISVIPFTVPGDGCGTEIIIKYSKSTDSLVIGCSTGMGSNYVVSSGYLSFTISLQTSHSTPVKTDYCLYVFSANKQFNVLCESSNIPDSTSPERSTTAIVDTTKPSTWSTVPAGDIETTSTGASSQTATIIVAVVGGLVVLAIICITYIVLRYRRGKLKTPSAETSVQRDKYSNDNAIDSEVVKSDTFQSCDKQYEDINEVEAAQVRNKSESSQNDVFQLSLQSTQTKYDDGNMNTDNSQGPIQANSDDTSTVIYAKSNKHVLKNVEETNRNGQFPVYALPVKNKNNDESDEVVQPVNRIDQTKSLVNYDGLQYADLCLENNTKYETKRDLNLPTKSDVEYADLQL